MLELDYDISLARCPKLQDRKEALLHYWRSVIKKHETVSTLVEEIIESQDSELFLSLLSDCSRVPQVARAAQTDRTVVPLLYKVTDFTNKQFSTKSIWPGNTKCLFIVDNFDLVRSPTSGPTLSSEPG